MKRKRKPFERRLDRLKDTLRRAGVRLTHQRLEIFREIASTGEHPDAESVYKRLKRRLPTVSLDTVYRNLWLLRDLGLIDTLGVANRSIRFDANMTPHHHFICTVCGRTQDFHCLDFDRLRAPKQAAILGRVEQTQVNFKGICLKCESSRKRKRRGIIQP